MTQTSNTSTQPNHPVSLIKPVLLGAAIGFILIALFLIGVKNPDPDWGKLWMLRPLIIVPLAGAVGGACYYFLNQLSARGSLNKAVAVILGIIIYIIGLWMGSIVGLDGTLWN